MRLPSPATLVLGLALLAGPALPAAAEAPLMPSRPDPRDLQRAMQVPRGYIGMFNTVVTRYSDRRSEVAYGMIFGNFAHHALVRVVNDVTGLTCEGETAEAADGSGQGSITCTQGGAVISVSPVEIEAGRYGKFNGIDSGVVLDPGGRQIGTFVSQWSAWDYPDPAGIMPYFQ